ncbi:DUF742 domain-containing protein [Streptomyces sp. PT12]|uniref:DUF742 domain-containing protein n=1 Tax=Streptomyces sp. PT12 TaxID=1510197 RepID=UPI000DE34B27|nr:DUF742 domain-containing protein [Streptomyces sp. PT12]RBM08090.1 DUF742 domain-containing protein [Streptomyces sp. PT12]
MTTPSDDDLEPPTDPLEPEYVELVRPYVITNGRDVSDTSRFELITLVTAADDTQRKAHLDPEKRDLVTLCEGGYLSVAEIAGHLRLPVGIVKVLLVDLVESGLILTRRPIPPAQLADIQVLQEVLDGLQARFG